MAAAVPKRGGVLCEGELDDFFFDHIFSAVSVLFDVFFSRKRERERERIREREGGGTNEFKWGEREGKREREKEREGVSERGVSEREFKKEKRERAKSLHLLVRSNLSPSSVFRLLISERKKGSIVFHLRLVVGRERERETANEGESGRAGLKFFSVEKGPRDFFFHIFLSSPSSFLSLPLSLSFFLSLRSISPSLLGCTSLSPRRRPGPATARGAGETGEEPKDRLLDRGCRSRQLPPPPPPRPPSTTPRRPLTPRARPVSTAARWRRPQAGPRTGTTSPETRCGPCFAR